MVQVDYVYPIDKNTQFEAGYRGTDNKRMIDFEVRIIDENDNLRIDENLSNVMDFEQEVHALYTQYGKKFNTFSFLAGLRFENTKYLLNNSTRAPRLIKKAIMIIFRLLTLVGKSALPQALH